MVKCRIIRIYADLRDHGRHRNVSDAPVQKLFPERILKIITNVCLAHGDADRQRRVRLLRVFVGESDHGVVHHTDLGTVAVSNDDLAAFLDQVNNGPGSDLHGFHLFRKRIAKGVSAESNYDTFLFFHNEPPALSLFYSGNRLYLTENSLWKRLYRNAGARRFPCKILRVYFIKCCKISHISEEAGCLHNVCEFSSLTFKKRFDILHDLLSLLFDRGADYFSCFRRERDLSGEEGNPIQDDSL